MKRALVLSGGGSKGAFQAGALAYLYEKEYTYDSVYGVSVGALNGYMVASNNFHLMAEIWQNISNNQVYTPPSFMSYVKLIWGAKGLYSNEPLRELLKAYVALKDLSVPFYAGFVDLADKGWVLSKINDLITDSAAVNHILASTTMPIIWPPVNGDWVDGGVRNVVPLADAAKADVEEIVFISCSPVANIDRPDVADGTKNIIDVIKKTLSVMVDEISTNDVDNTLRINELVKQADEQGLMLLKKDGTPYKYINIKVIRPDHNLHDTLDFSQQSVSTAWNYGYDKAQEVVG